MFPELSVKKESFHHLHPLSLQMRLDTQAAASHQFLFSLIIEKTRLDALNE
jgi:hypothetical protein